MIFVLAFNIKQSNMESSDILTFFTTKLLWKQF